MNKVGKKVQCFPKIQEENVEAKELCQALTYLQGLKEVVLYHFETFSNKGESDTRLLFLSLIDKKNMLKTFA